MFPTCTIGSMTTGHCYYPIPASVGCPKVLTNMIPTVNTGCYWNFHWCGDSCHPGWAAVSVTPNIIACGSPVHTVCSALSCGDVAATGAPNVVCA